MRDWSRAPHAHWLAFLWLAKERTGVQSSFTMAWRIERQVVRGEIDNRTHGRISGKIWLIGKAEPVVLDLKGNGDRDMAGRVLRFSNPDPEVGEDVGLMVEQRGWTGDLTASCKVKVPDCSVEEMMRLGKKFPWHWANCLYLEWFSEANGRVVIEATDFELELTGEPEWKFDEAEEEKLQQENGQEMLAFSERLEPDFGDHGDDDEPQSKAEAEADADTARMDVLLDRVTARLDREGTDDFEKVLREERERLRKEWGEPEIEVDI